MPGSINLDTDVSARKRNLFVDDEPAILDILQRLFRKDARRWEIVFVASGALGLEEARKQPFDVVVSDMRMPGVDGATLLHVIKHECPATVRIMWTGCALDAALERVLPALHTVVYKPCDVATLRGMIERG